MNRLLPTAAVFVALALAGCVPQPSDPYTEMAHDALARLEGLDDDDRRAAALESAAHAEADARQALGLDEALGGTAAGDAVFAALQQPLRSLAESGGPVMAVAPASVRAGSGSLGSFLGLAFTMVGGLGENGVGLANHGEVGSATTAIPGGEAEVTIGTDGRVSSSFTSGLTEGSTRATISARTDVQGCPEPDGALELSGSSTMRVESGGISMSIELDVVATGVLDDTATLVESDYTYRHQTSATEDGHGQFFDHSSGARADVTVNRISSDATLPFAQSAVDSAAVLADMVARDLLAAAQQRWESGSCVDVTLLPSEDPGSLEPGAEVTIDVTARSTLDGGSVGGTMTAALEGEGSLDPQGTSIPTPVFLTYTAPDEDDLSGTVTVESRSNRGVGRATLHLETGGQAYSAFAAAGEFVGRGTICSLTAPFTTTGNGLTFTFTPGGTVGGTWRMTGTIDGVTFIGDGAYELVWGPEHLATNLIVDGDMTLTTPEGIATTTPADIDYQLTPVAPCE